MDPKGDRLRKIKMGTLKLPESVLRSNNIVLTPEPLKLGGGCLEGGARPRPLQVLGKDNLASGDSKLVIGSDGSLKTVDMSVIPLPNDADIPLPKDLVPETDIPLPMPLSSENIPLPKDSDIPLPPDDLIPLPADKPSQQPEKKKKVLLTRLEPTGDELLCRSCEMKFLKQVDYDTHLQTESHQQAIEADLKEGRSHGIGLLIPRQNKKSPSHDVKSGHVSFSFKKNIGSRITNAQPFHQRNEQRISPEIKILKLEGENQNDKGEVSRDGTNSQTGAEKVLCSMKGLDVNESKLLCSFVKVQSKDDSGRVLDWPKEMIQYTQTEPKITYSCNPLCFDFSQLFGIKSKKSPIQANVINEKEGDEVETQGSGLLVTDENIEKKGDSEKKKSHKKKKKKKHKKHKEKTDDKETNEGENKEGSAENKAPEVEGKPDAAEGETASGKKKKKKKHKKKDKDNSTAKEGEEEKEKAGDDGVDIADKDKKKHKKSKKRKHQSEAEDENKTGGEEEKKSKKRKKSKKSKKRKRKHQSDKENEKSDGEADTEKKSEVKKNGENTDTSADETDAEKDKEGKRKQKKKKKKSKKKEGGNESSDEEPDKTGDKPENTEKTTVKVTNNISIKKKLGHEVDTEHEKIVAKLQAIKSLKPTPLLNAVNPLSNAAQIKKVKPEIIDKKTLIDRKRVNSESSVSESTPSNVKKAKVTPKTLSGLIDNTITVGQVAVANVKVEKEDSWVKIENQTTDNVKSKWDTSESDMENALDKNVKTKKKISKVTNVQRKTVQAKRELMSQQPKLHPKNETDVKKSVNPSLSQRSNKSNVSAGSAKKQASAVKTRKKSRSPASSRSSRSRSRSYSHRRSYSRSSSRSRSHSYSSSSSYSSGYSHSRHRRRHSSSRSYSRSRSRSRSRSYRRGRARSSSYSSSYSRSTYSRSRSRSHRRRKRRRSYSRSRSYSSSSYSSRSRSRSYRRKSRRKAKRRTKHKQQKPQKTVAVTTNEKESTATIKTPAEKEPVKEPNVDPSDIPLPDLSGKKEDEKSEEKLAKLKEKKPRTDVGQTVAKLVESLPSDIPLPFSENSAKTVSSDALPSSPPTTATKESETGFIGPKLPNSNMAPPPPPPPGHLRFPNHGPPGPPHPGFRPNQWDHWGPGPWDGPGHWDGPGPGPRPYRGMRPPFDPRMAGPFDPRMRRPPPFMNRHGPMHMGPRYPGPHGPPHDYDYEYEYPPEYDSQYTEDEPPKNESPPPLPPPKNPSPKPPPPEKKEKEIKEPEQNPSIVIPPEQAEQYKHLQKQAAKHARRQRRRQQKKELGEPEEDSSSSDSEPEQQEVQATEMVEEEQHVLLEEMQPQLMAMPQQVMLAQPQPASSPAGYVVAVSNGQQILLQKQPTFVQGGIPVQAGQPVMISQGANAAMLAAAASGAQPAHIVQQVPSGLAGVQHGQLMTQAHIPQGIQLLHSSASLQQLQQLQHIQQIQQAQQIQQIQQAHAIQAHNQAVAAAHAAQHTGHIIVGNQILVPRIGMRPAM